MLDYDHQTVRSVDWVAGAAMVVRRETVDDVGPMDDRYFLYFEDVDWCRRMHTRGWDVHYLPSSVMVHHWQRASAAFSSSTQTHIKSGLKFYERWGVPGYLVRQFGRQIATGLLFLMDTCGILLSFWPRTSFDNNWHSY